MQCPDIDLLDLHASGDVDDETRRQVDRHVRSCPGCRSRLEEVQANLRHCRPVRDALRSEEPAPELSVPDRIGEFRIVREIGRGGMGVVYLAEQQKPSRQVALKVLRGASPSAERLRRFEHEADALGRLRHPGIAAVHAAGVAQVESGGVVDRVPYFAMEYVRGERLDHYVEKRHLGIRSRIELLARVTDAVHHAHLNGIVHRDLKPGNILVEEPEGSARKPAGATKILDFGVSRVSRPDRAAETFLTSRGEILGTVPYMSPEQLGGDPAEIDARSDVYSLGVVAFEILAGELPLDFAGKSLAEAARIVREAQPRRLGSVDVRLRGDLETIVSKALQKDAAQRYQSASELAADLRRFLADEAIQARPPGVVYQLWKLARRNRLAFGLTSALILALLVFAVSMTWLFQRARTAENEARIEAQTSQQTADFLFRMFADAVPAERNPEEVSARELIDSAAQTIAELDDQPVVQARMLFAIGSLYRELGLYTESRPLLERSLEIRREALGDADRDVAQSLRGLAVLFELMGDLPAAERHARKALRVSKASVGTETVEHASYLDALARVLHESGSWEETLRLRRQVLEILLLHPREENGLQIATATNNIATVLVQLGQYEEADSMFREALATYRELTGEHHTRFASILYNIGAIRFKMGRPDEAEPFFREALAIQQEIVGSDHPKVASQLHNLSRALADQGRHEEAVPLLREALAIRERALAASWVTQETRSILGVSLAALGRAHEAEELLESSVARMTEIRGPDDPFVVRARERLKAFRAGTR